VQFSQSSTKQDIQAAIREFRPGIQVSIQESGVVGFKVMKLLMINDLYPPTTWADMRIRCKETAEELRRRGHEVEILNQYLGADGSEVENQVHRLLESNPLNNPREVAFRDFLKLRRRYLSVEVGVQQPEKL